MLDAAQAAANGGHADLDCIGGLAEAVSDSAWDGGDAARILHRAEVTADWLQSANTWAVALTDDGCWQVETGSDALERAASLSSGLGRLGVVIATVHDRYGPRAPPLTGAVRCRVIRYKLPNVGLPARREDSSWNSL